MASGIYNICKGNLFRGEYDLEGDTVKVSLYDTNHAFTASDTVYTSTNELPTTGGYTLGGATLSSPVVTDGATTKWDDDGSNTSWTTATFTAKHAVLWDDTHATDELIVSIDFGALKTVTSGTFTIEWNAAGIITLA